MINSEVKLQNWVRYFIMRPVITYAFLLILLAAIALSFSPIKTGFLPEMDEGSIVLDYASPPGTSLKKPTGCLRKWKK